MAKGVKHTLPRGGKVADEGLRKVTFGAMVNYRQFQNFCNVRVPDNRVRWVDTAGRAEFTDPPNPQIKREAERLGGRWS